MFGITEEHIINHQRGEDGHLSDADGVRIYYNQTDPYTIRDGVNSITVVEKDDHYLVVYWGYLAGKMRVRREGIAELGRNFLTYRGETPHWLVDRDSVDVDNLPWWMPDDIDLNPHVQCQRCGEPTPVASIVTPGGFEEFTPDDQFCGDCWDEVSDSY